MRNLTDPVRYNLCMPIAQALGFDTRSEGCMWRDRAMTEAAVAVMHSFRQAGLGMVDHHTLQSNFRSWCVQTPDTYCRIPANGAMRIACRMLLSLGEHRSRGRALPP